jgi:site-specific DNA-methyltransferase (adenine-specific)
MQLHLDTILNGDCVEVLRSLPDKCVDLIFADPPYNLQLQNELVRPNQTIVDAVNDEWDKFESFADYDTFTKAWLTECRRVLKDDATIWVIGSYHNIYRVGAIMMDLGYWILNDIHWYKTNPMPNFRGTRFTNATESMIWAKKSENQKKYTFHHHAMKHLNEDKQMQNVWEIPLCTGEERLKEDGKKAHSTQKPEALLYRVLLSSSNPGDVVLDPFFGSGTTGAVAKKLCRHFIGIERDPGYVKLAQKRIEDITPPLVVEETLLVTPSKRSQERIAFGVLIEAGLLEMGQTLFSKDRKHKASINADSHITLTSAEAGVSGSIHRVAATAMKQTAFNGWDFWYYENPQGELVSIDLLRNELRNVSAKK